MYSAIGQWLTRPEGPSSLSMVSPGQLSFGMVVMVALPALKPGAWLLELPDIQAARLKRWTVLSA